MTNHKEARETLSERLIELEVRSARLKTDISEPMSADFEEQAVEIEDDEALLAQEVLVTQKIAAVRAAITRVDTGRYGICLECGSEITSDRLKAIPETTLCISCAKQRP
ncbi:MAG: TraR/DksA C4-type zinc finger protein [Chakrabartia sp.]